MAVLDDSFGRNDTLTFWEQDFKIEGKRIFSFMLVMGLWVGLFQQTANGQKLHWDANLGVGLARPFKANVYPVNRFNAAPQWTIGTFLGAKQNGAGIYLGYSGYQWETDTLPNSENPTLSRHNTVTTALCVNAKIAALSSLRLTLGPTLNRIYDERFEKPVYRFGSLASISFLQKVNESLFFFTNLGLSRATVRLREDIYSWSNAHMQMGFGFNLIRGTAIQKSHQNRDRTQFFML